MENESPRKRDLPGALALFFRQPGKTVVKGFDVSGGSAAAAAQIGNEGSRRKKGFGEGFGRKGSVRKTGIGLEKQGEIRLLPETADQGEGGSGAVGAVDTDGIRRVGKKEGESFLRGLTGRGLPIFGEGQGGENGNAEGTGKCDCGSKEPGVGEGLKEDKIRSGTDAGGERGSVKLRQLFRRKRGKGRTHGKGNSSVSGGLFCKAYTGSHDLLRGRAVFGKGLCVGAEGIGEKDLRSGGAEFPMEGKNQFRLLRIQKTGEGAAGGTLPEGSTHSAV